MVFDALTLESDSSHFAQLQELGTRLWGMEGGIDAAFQKLSEPGEDGIPYSMFGKLLSLAGIEVDEEMALALAETCDLSKSGQVRSDDLKQNIKIIDRSGSSSNRNLDKQIGRGASIGRRASAISGLSLSAAAGAATAAAKMKGAAAERRAKVGWQDGIIHQIKNVIFQHRTELGAIFRDFDNGTFVRSSDRTTKFSHVCPWLMHTHALHNQITAAQSMPTSFLRASGRLIGSWNRRSRMNRSYRS